MNEGGRIFPPDMKTKTKKTGGIIPACFGMLIM